MIFKRFTAGLRAQNWLAIAIEFAIVVAGVFVGNWVNDWSQARLESAETAHRMRQLEPELKRIQARAALMQHYYEITRRYSQTAFAGWSRDPAVSDNAFVIAAYQASQIKGIASSSQAWSTIVGADQLRNIDDPAIREPMIRMLTFPEENLSLMRVQTRYRDDVRSIIPDILQQAIRARCGDYLANPDALDFSLRERCDLTLDPAAAAQAAADLRRHPELVGELRLHLALVSSQLNDVRLYDTAAGRLRQALER